MPKKKTWSESFEVKNNFLFYIPALGNTQSPDHALKVEGKWDITKNGRLRFVVDHGQNKIFGKTITIGTELSRVDTGSLEFKAAHRVTTGGKDVASVTLNGELTALSGKKLAFTVDRDGIVDTLKLEGSWDVLADNQIGCIVKRTCDGKKITDLVVLKGIWQIAGNKMSYEIERSNRPFLSQEFKIERAVFTNTESGMELTLGAGIKHQTTQRDTSDTVFLKGVWKQEGTKAEFVFTSARRQSFTFTLSRKLSDDKELVFELDTGEDKKPSFAVTFTKKIKGDSSFFIRGKISENERRAEAGFYLPF